jgi:hypothetical protein
MTTTQQQTVDFACPVARLHDYVTQPWRWHEWHPSSRSARATVPTLAVGDTFDEVIELQPFAPLPIRLRRETHYRVEVAERNRVFEVFGDTGDGWLRIRYDFAPTQSGTRFVRTLSFDARGASRLLLPLLRRRQETLGRLALQNLKRRVESDAVL